MLRNMSVFEKFDYFINYFSKVSKEHDDFVESVLLWDDETKIAYQFVKQIFEEK